MAITISGANNVDKILATDGVLDSISGFNVVGVMTAANFDVTGKTTTGHINIGNNIQIGNAGIITATTLVGNVTGNINHTSNLLLQISGSEKFRVGTSGQLGIGGANYGSSGQVLTSGGSGAAASWSTINGTTINNNAANKVIMGSNTANTLEAVAKSTLFGNLSHGQNFLDDNNLIFGDASDMILIHQASGAKSRIRNTNDSGSLDIESTLTRFTNKDGSSEKLRIDSAGRLLLGTTTEGHDAADNLTIADSGNCGITIRSGTSNNGNLYFSDGTSGGDEYRGYVNYNHSSNYMMLATNGSERLRIRASGQVQFSNGTFTDNVDCVMANGGTMEIGAQSTIKFRTATNEIFRINSSGQMGLGISSPQANAKLQVNGNIGAAQFYTTTTSAPQTDFNSDVATNKAGLLIRRSSETNGDYGGIEFHNHPSSNTAYRKGGIYFQSDGSGFGRGDMVFVNDGAGDSANLAISDERMRIHREGYLTTSHQVGFYATANSGGTVTMSSTHTLTNWRLSTSGKTYSIGGHFNTSNGRFTAPVSGQYLFTGSILLQNYDTASGIHMMWRKNGSNYQYWYNTRTSDIDRSGYGGYLAQGSTTTFSMVANDYIEVACNFSGTLKLWCGDANWGHFSGYFLG